ncbi:MAG: hypothetical protein AB8B61_01115, partial [Cyclobacteriaceae bacterium]
IETNIAVCLQKTEAICSQLIALDRDVSLQLHTALGEETICTTSSVSRELIYVIEHTVHHMAILKMGAIINFPSVKFPENFGFAQSTIDYQSTCAQ